MKISDLSNRDLIIEVLSKINRTHAAVHIHANNCGRVLFCGKYILPDTLEVTFLSKDLHDFKLSNAVLPRDMDFPNCKDVGEIILGRWNV